MSVSAFRLYKLHDIPESLRLLAHKIECGEEDAIRCLVIMENDEGTEYKAFGAEPFTQAHAIGLCHVAAYTIMNPGHGEDDE